MPNDSAVALQAVSGGNENQFRGLQCFGHAMSDRIAVQSKGVALAIKTKWRDYGGDTLSQEGLQKFRVDAFHLAGVLVVRTGENAEGVSSHSVGIGSAQIVRGKPFEDFVCEPIGCGESQLQGDVIGNARAVEIAWSEGLLLGELGNLFGGTVD